MTTLALDGDQIEKDYWDEFIKDKFPSYETFWLKKVFPLRQFGKLNYKSDEELTHEGKSRYDVDIAQLGYGLFRNLVRAWQILKKLKEDPKNSDPFLDQIDLMIEGVTRLVGAHDLASELFEKLNRPVCYKPFDKDDSKLAGRRWRKENRSLFKIREYRNYLIHNSLPPQIFELNLRSCVPKIGTQDKYRDQRIITNDLTEEIKKDFEPVNRVFEFMWGETVDYIERSLDTKVRTSPSPDFQV